MNRPFSSHSTKFELNGRKVTAVHMPGQRLSETLREGLGQKDVKIGMELFENDRKVLFDKKSNLSYISNTNPLENEQVKGN